MEPDIDLDEKSSKRRGEQSDLWGNALAHVHICVCVCVSERKGERRRKRQEKH